MEKLDLFNSLVRYLAVKPIEFDDFDVERARSIIKEENRCCITFLARHGFLEATLNEIVGKVTDYGVKNGTAYLYVKGEGCTERMKRHIIELTMNVHKLIIFGDPERWPVRDPRITFVDPEGLFEDNHQRFFIFQSPSYNIAVVARHVARDGEEMIEGAMSNVANSVSFLAQSVGTRIYHNHS